MFNALEAVVVGLFGTALLLSLEVIVVWCDDEIAVVKANVDRSVETQLNQARQETTFM
jgi:hypothetical protein